MIVQYANKSLKLRPLEVTNSHGAHVGNSQRKTGNFSYASKNIVNFRISVKLSLKILIEENAVAISN